MRHWEKAKNIEVNTAIIHFWFKSCIFMCLVYTDMYGKLQTHDPAFNGEHG